VSWRTFGCGLVLCALAFLRKNGSEDGRFGETSLPLGHSGGCAGLAFGGAHRYGVVTGGIVGAAPEGSLGFASHHLDAAAGAGGGMVVVAPDLPAEGGEGVGGQVVEAVEQLLAGDERDPVGPGEIASVPVEAVAGNEVPVSDMLGCHHPEERADGLDLHRAGMRLALDDGVGLGVGSAVEPDVDAAIAEGIVVGATELVANSTETLGAEIGGGEFLEAAPFQRIDQLECERAVEGTWRLAHDLDRADRERGRFAGARRCVIRWAGASRGRLSGRITVEVPTEFPALAERKAGGETDDHCKAANNAEEEQRRSQNAAELKLRCGVRLRRRTWGGGSPLLRGYHAWQRQAGWSRLHCPVRRRRRCGGAERAHLQWRHIARAGSGGGRIGDDLYDLAGDEHHLALRVGKHFAVVGRGGAGGPAEALDHRGLRVPFGDVGDRLGGGALCGKDRGGEEQADEETEPLGVWGPTCHAGMVAGRSATASPKCEDTCGTAHACAVLRGRRRRAESTLSRASLRRSWNR